MRAERWNPPIFFGKTIEVLMNDGSFETDFIFWLMMLIWEAFFPTATSQCKTCTQVLGACLEYIYIYIYIHTHVNNDGLFPWRNPHPDILRFGKMGVVTQIFSPQKSHMPRSRSREMQGDSGGQKKATKKGTVLVVGCRD